MSTERAATPPSRAEAISVSSKPPLTPEQRRRIEENRLRAKAIYEAKQAERAAASSNPLKRPASTSDPSASTPPRATRQRTLRDASQLTPPKPTENNSPFIPSPQPARKFTKFVDYDFSKMNDTKGGFLDESDDPFHGLDLSGKPKNMSVEAWAKVQLKEKLAKEKKGAFEAPISVLDVKYGEDGKRIEDRPLCFECESLEIDPQFWEVFKCRVCHNCKEKLPDKYSLLTKTECREDYLLTDPELRDEELLPHLEKPNPHKSTWNNMMLYVRYQVEAFAFKKWGSPEALDAEFERRVEEKKRKKGENFKKKLRELKNKTRVETWKRRGPKREEKHVHTWGNVVEREGVTVSACEECGFEREEIIF